MKFIHGEILFKSYDEALEQHELMSDNHMVIYSCTVCGLYFGTVDPYCADHGITCRVCVKAMNLHEEDNYRPDYDDYTEDEQMFEPYDDNTYYGD